MRFRDWIRRHTETAGEVAARLHVHRVTVQRWISGADIPRHDVAERIRELTGGEVTPTDFADAHTEYLNAKGKAA